MPDWILLIIGFVSGSVMCIIYEIVSAYRRDRETWFAPIGTDGEDTVYQCRKCGESFSCKVIEYVSYCPACGREVKND